METTNTNVQLPAKLLKASEVSEILNISKAYAYQLMKQGVIRAVKIGGAVRVRPSDLENYIEESLTPPQQW